MKIKLVFFSYRFYTFAAIISIFLCFSHSRWGRVKKILEDTKNAYLRSVDPYEIKILILILNKGIPHEFLPSPS